MTQLLRFLAKHHIQLHSPFSAPRSYQKPKRGDARDDFNRVVKDMRAVGTDLRRVSEKTLTEYGQ
jgi:hypothetical protein